MNKKVTICQALGIFLVLFHLAGCHEETLPIVSSSSGDAIALESSSLISSTESVESLDIFSSAYSPSSSIVVQSSSDSTPMEPTSSKVTVTSITESVPTMSEEGENIMNNNCKLIVNNNDITEFTYVNLHENYADIPILAICEALGVSVTRIDSTNVILSYNDINYKLDMKECLLTQEGETINILSLPPGGTQRHFQIKNNDLIVDSITSRSFINLLGAKLSIDYDEAIVFVNNK